MGLTGDLQIFLDAETGIPVGVRGELPVVGKTDFKLTEVTLKDGAGQQASRRTKVSAKGLPQP